MGKLVCTVLLILGLAACSDAKSAPEAVAAQSEMPETCAYDSTGPFQSRAWGLITADRYNCSMPGLEKMTCYFYKASGGAIREIQCENISNLDPQPRPAECDEMYWTGITGADRVFFDGVQRASNGHKCPGRYGLQCDYFQHRTSTTAADNFQCITL